MIIDDFMFHVAKVWYRVYWGLMVATNAAVLVGVAATQMLPPFRNLGVHLNLNGHVTLVLSAVTLGYLLTVYWVAVRTYGLTMATLLGTMLNALVLLNGVHNTDPTQWAYIYVALWVLTSGLNGMYG
ncbi:MAG TPA: hypothetical protein VKQ34_02790, partial [Candidatus Saccharimonadales bacterium]|nr:hypothetical protein [Candidatus Saccharimonadales bacterium]